jgi:hypothetical protein
MQPPNRGRPPQPGRGRGPARWTGIEIALILLSAVMIAYPLFAGALRFVAPPVAPAQETTPEQTVEPPTDTPDPVFQEPPTDTPAPPPTDTAAPPPSDTAGPPPADTAAPLPSDTAAPPPSDTAAPPPADTAAPLPSDTAAPGVDQIATATNRPATPTSTVGAATPTSTTGPITPTNTVGPTTPTNTPNPAFSPTPTQAVVAGVRVFKVASVAEAAPGQNFSYSVSVLTTSTVDQQVTMTDGVDGNLEVLSASSSSGSCTTGQTVSCGLTIRADNPASVTIQVRVRTSTPSGTSISNSASAGGASSETVSVRVVGSPVSSPTPSPTGPTATPGGPTATPGGPTATPGGPTATPGGPTVTAVPPPTSVPPPTERPREGGGGERRPAATPVPPAPPAPPTPIPGVPTEPPTPEAIIIFDPARPPQVRPTAAVRPTRVALAPTRTPASLIPIPPGTTTAGTAVATGSPQPTTGPGATTDVFFRMASDWGSAYPGQQVNYTIVVRNTRPPAAGGANDLRNVRVSSNLPGNVQVLGARADRGTDPTVSGNSVSYSIAQLQPGEGVEITVASQIRPDVTIGTLLVAQSQLLYDGLAQAAFSNIVSVQVVGNAQAPTASAVIGSPTPQQPNATTGASPTAGTPAAGASATPQRTASATAAAQQPTAAAPTAVPTVAPPKPAPLPETSAGVPLFGIALLGGTLLTRTWRLHRAKSRV